mmetsp:Transcript_56405/g.150233  ORF Transcript_56405/g.150233 Transcript_56405/m.150233 type:complete len:588 (-) Transcript_56405:186-1949(-)
MSEDEDDDPPLPKFSFADVGQGDFDLGGDLARDVLRGLQGPAFSPQSGNRFTPAKDGPVVGPPPVASEVPPPPPPPQPEPTSAPHSATPGSHPAVGASRRQPSAEPGLPPAPLPPLKKRAPAADKGAAGEEGARSAPPPDGLPPPKPGLSGRRSRPPSSGPESAPAPPGGGPDPRKPVWRSVSTLADELRRRHGPSWRGEAPHPDRDFAAAAGPGPALPTASASSAAPREGVPPPPPIPKHGGPESGGDLPDRIPFAKTGAGVVPPANFKRAPQPYQRRASEDPGSCPTEKPADRRRPSTAGKPPVDVNGGSRQTTPRSESEMPGTPLQREPQPYGGVPNARAGSSPGRQRKESRGKPPPIPKTSPDFEKPPRQESARASPGDPGIPPRPPRRGAAPPPRPQAEQKQWDWTPPHVDAFWRDFKHRQEKGAPAGPGQPQSGGRPPPPQGRSPFGHQPRSGGARASSVPRDPGWARDWEGRSKFVPPTHESPPGNRSPPPKQDVPGRAQFGRSRSFSVPSSRAAKQKESRAWVMRQVQSELDRLDRVSDVDQKRKAFKALLLKWHPDKNPDDPALAKEVFGIVNGRRPK